MENTQKLTEFITNTEKSKALAFLSKIRGEVSCQKYAQAREKVLMVEVVKELNKKLPAFYVDVKSFAENLFSENPPSADEAIGLLCQEVRAADREDRQRAFKKVFSYILENMCDSQLALGSVAEYAGVSPSALTKLFTENTGMTPADYLGRLRIQKSLELLKADLTVEKAAKKVGFTSDETYIRTFKRIMGITPGAWKRNNLSL